MQLSATQEKRFISLYQNYGRSWDWSAYASAISHGDNHVSPAEMRRYVEYNRRRLQDAGLSFPQLPRRIDKERFAELYAIYEDTWTWAQYAEKLSELQGFSGKDAFTATSISAYVSRHRDELNAPLRQVASADEWPWPEVNLQAYKQQHYWRFLILHLRVMKYGEEALAESSPARLRRYLQTRNRLWRDKEVIRYDPDRGFFSDLAHEDELDPPRLVERSHYYYARHPEHTPKI